MNEPRNDLVIGVFEQEAQAEQAVSALWRAGFAPDRIDMANRRMGVVAGTPRMQFQKEAADGATTGAVAGAGWGRGRGGGRFAAARHWHRPGRNRRGRSGGRRRYFPRTLPRHGNIGGRSPSLFRCGPAGAHPRDRAPDRTLGRGAGDSPQPRRTRTSRLSGPVNVRAET